jgi:endonuclease-3 related protein
MGPLPHTDTLLSWYQRLLAAFGPQGWWPGDTPFEIALGAILTQNTNWRNVARVIAALKAEGHLDPVILAAMPEEELAGHLKSAGYYNLKARRVKNFLAFFAARFNNSMPAMAAAPWPELRRELLAVQGIGPETADSILLYALEHPSFVVDAYTYRILNRHGLAPEPCSYEDLRALFMDRLPPEVPLYQEYHALLVRLGKEFCRPRPRCAGCPLEPWRGPEA